MQEPTIKAVAVAVPPPYSERTRELINNMGLELIAYIKEGPTEVYFPLATQEDATQVREALWEAYPSLCVALMDIDVVV